VVPYRDGLYVRSVTVLDADPDLNDALDAAYRD
jgi:hypothetical protein